MQEKLKKLRTIFDLDLYKNKTDEIAKAWVEDNFPEKFYGDDILFYEGWPLRSLLEQAFMAGRESTSTD